MQGDEQVRSQSDPTKLRIKINVMTPYNMGQNLIVNLVYLVGPIGTPFQ